MQLNQAEGTQVVLRDGSTVLIRQVRGTDAPLLADGFARLSPRSRQLRFLGPKTTLSATELRYFTEIDHHDHEAIGALSAADGRGVGIARYVRDARDPQAAEIAVTIVDDWQERGLGTELLSRLSDLARQAASTGSPPWSPQTTPRAPGCYGTWAPPWSPKVPASWNTSSPWSPTTTASIGGSAALWPSCGVSPRCRSQPRPFGKVKSISPNGRVVPGRR